MENQDIKIHDNKISVDEILKRIQENVRQRQEAESETEMESGSDTCNSDKRSELLRRDIIHINSNWNIQNNDYIITSQKPFFGKLLIKGRQLVHGEVRRYVDPMISRQSGFNGSVARTINETTQKNAELEQQCAGLAHQYAELELKLKNLEDSFYAGQKIQDQKISQFIDLIDRAIEIKIDERINNHLTQMDGNIHERAWLAHILEERIQKGLGRRSSGSATPSPELNYYLFEERFRGARESIRQQQLAFLPFFENCVSVLDIGCGRGEFLEILRDHNIGGTGIDIDPDMIRYCRSHHLSVEQSDAITYLENISDESLDGIFIDQVVEHLEPDYLVKMLGICYQKLRWGSNIVVETVNPLSLASFFNFYLDMSHHKPVHPLTLDFLLESVGFRGNVIKYYSAISDQDKLQKIPIPEKISEIEQKFLSTCNSNIEQLNNLLWGPRDYAIIGRK